MVDEEPVSAPFLSLTCKIVAAYVRKNPVPVSGVPNVIESVHDALKDIVTGVSASKGSAKKPAISVNRSVTPDYIICLEDGKKLTGIPHEMAIARGLSNGSPELRRTALGHSEKDRAWPHAASGEQTSKTRVMPGDQ